MCSKRKLNELTTENIKEAIDLIAKGVGQQAIAVKFGVAKSTIGNIGNNREAILKAWEENCDSERRKKLRKTDNAAVKNVMLQFFLNVMQ
jgi:DNA invertase Pin-like site-specific DNA recombinase